MVKRVVLTRNPYRGGAQVNPLGKEKPASGATSPGLGERSEPDVNKFSSLSTPTQCPGAEGNPEGGSRSRAQGCPQRRARGGNACAHEADQVAHAEQEYRRGQAAATAAPAMPNRNTGTAPGKSVRRSLGPSSGAEKTGGRIEALLGPGGLSKGERKELLDRLALDAQQTAKRDPELDMWADAVSEALVGRLGPADGYGGYLVRRLLGSAATWAPVRGFVASSGLGELTVPERRAFYQLLADMMVSHAAEVSARSGSPLGPKLVGACSANVAGVFERSFPGYRAAGLMPVLARQMRSSLR